MSAAPRYGAQLRCEICRRPVRDFAGLRRHQNAAHGRTAGLGFPISGRKRRRATDDSSSSLEGPPPAGGAPLFRSGARQIAAGDTSGSKDAIVEGVGNEPPPVPSEPRSDAGSDFSTGSGAVSADLQALYEMARTQVDADDDAGEGGASAAVSHTREYSYGVASTHIRALYEHMQDVQRATPLAELRRKKPHTGKFNSYRLRALQNFVLNVGGAGLSLSEQERLFDFLDVWDRTRADMPEDDGHNRTLRDSFNNANEFRNALADDLDMAVNQAGWKKVELAEDGEKYEAYFRSVMGVVRSVVANTNATGMNWWSGGSAPAALNNRRETPMDGEVYKVMEQAVMDEHGPNSAILGIHVYSDSSQLSWSGGTSLSHCGTASVAVPLASDRHVWGGKGGLRDGVALGRGLMASCSTTTLRLSPVFKLYPVCSHSAQALSCQNSGPQRGWKARVARCRVHPGGSHTAGEVGS